MNSTQPPAPPATTNTGGRPRESDRPRVSISASCDARTDDRLNDWLARMQEKHPKANLGRVLDRLVIFATRGKFDPLHPSLEAPRPAKKMAGGASTPTPA
jgi:hypothetical protein